MLSLAIVPCGQKQMDKNITNQHIDHKLSSTIKDEAKG